MARLRSNAPASTPLASSRGLILAEDVFAPTDLPRFSNSAMDGFAVRSAETTFASRKHPVRLSIVGELEAGEEWDGTLGPLETVRINTGAGVPSPCDAVIPAELLAEADGQVHVHDAIERLRNVRLQGEDIRASSLAVAQGTLLRAQEIGLLAALGIDSVLAIPIPRLSIVSMGPELLPGARPAPVHDANGPMLAAQATAAGAEPVHIERCAGTPDELVDLLRRLGRTADLVLTSGGISDSDADLMAALLGSLPDGELWNVRLRPGKHFGVGFLDELAVVALPGNPIAAFVGFELFARPAIDLLAGRSIDHSSLRARTAHQLSGSMGRTDAIRGHAWHDADGQLWTTITVNRGSGAIATLPEANCLILIPEETETVEPGEPVEIRWVGYQ